MAKINHFVGSFADDTSANSFMNLNQWNFQIGLTYYDTFLDVIKMWDGSKWIILGGTSFSPILRANCLSSDVVGNAVYMTGPVVGDLYQVETVDISQSRIISGIYSGMDVNKSQFIDSDGSLVGTPPTPPPGSVYLWQVMGRAISDDILYLDPSKFILGKRG
jgi:hypothetical protein